MSFENGILLSKRTCSSCDQCHCVECAAERMVATVASTASSRLVLHPFFRRLVLRFHDPALTDARVDVDHWNLQCQPSRMPRCDACGQR